MIPQPTLSDDLVTLVPLTAEHTGGLAAAGSGDRGSYAYTWVPDGHAEAEMYVAHAVTERTAGAHIPYTVLRDGEVVGSTRFCDLTWFASGTPRWAGQEATPLGPPQAMEIGHTWYAPHLQRTGVNTHCKLLLLTFAFDGWDCVRICLKADARNARSRTAMLRIGAQFEGIRRAHMTARDGTVRDTAYYSIVAAEWPAVRARLTDLAR